MEAISSELRKEMSSSITPSTTKIGELFPKVPTPLIRRVGMAPGAPEVLVT